MNRFFKKSMAVILVAAMAAMTGCGSGSSGEEGTKAAAAESASEAAKTKDSIVISTDWPTYIDPGVGSKASDSTAAVNIYDTLTFPNSDGTIDANAAESWDVSEDGTIYTFHLRDDVVFHSGNQLTASDVKYSMDRLMAMGEGFAYLFTDLVSEVKVIDEKTVEFDLSSPSGTFPAIIVRLYILDEKLMTEHYAEGDYGEQGDYGKAWLQTNDAGSGPYKVKEMKTEEYLVIEKYSEYWKGWEDGAPETIRMVGGLETTAIRTMISRGELDITNDAQTPEAYTEMDAMEGVDSVNILSGVNTNLMLNTKSAPTDDIHVRKAIAYATDYQTIINSIYPGSSLSTGPVVSGMTAAALTVEEMPYTYDLAKAEEELKQSPYYDQLMSGELTIAFTWCSEGGSSQEKLALLIQSEMGKLGVTVDITGKPFATMMTDAQTIETTPNASIVAFSPAYLDAGSVLKTRYHSGSCGSWEQMEWLQDNEIDSMIEKSTVIINEDERNEAYKEISRQLIELCPTVWLFDATTTVAYRSDHITSWPAVDMNQAGESYLYTMGYCYYFRDFKVAE